MGLVGFPEDITRDEIGLYQEYPGSQKRDLGHPSDFLLPWLGNRLRSDSVRRAGGLPEFYSVAIGIVEPGEAAVVVVLSLGVNVDGRRP